MQVKADLSSQIAMGGEGKIPMISRRSLSNFVSISSGQSLIIGGMIRPAARPDTEGNAKAPQTPAGELICIVTASIIAPPADSRFVTQVFQLKYAYPDLIKEKIEGAYKYPANEPQEAVRVIAFPTTKQVTVIASSENLSRIAEQIAEWDTFQVFKPRIIELKNSDPVQMARMLTMLFAEEDVDEVNIRNVILGEDITGPLSSHFIFEDVPGTSKIIVMSNIPKAYETVGQLIIELDKQKMVTKDVKQVREWIARLVSEGRLGGLNIGGVGIQIETRILTIDEGFFEDLSLDADSVDSLQSWPEYFAPDSSNLASLILDQRRVDLLFNAAMNHEGAKMLMSPRILVRDAEEASMFTGQEIPRVSGYAEPNEPSEKPTPEFEYVKMGTSIRIKAHLTPDKSKVYLDVRSETNQIRGFKERTFMDRYTHMIPQIHTASLVTGNTVPLGKTLLIGQRIRQDAHSKFDKLVLADVSPVERSFPDETSRPEPTVLLMLLKPTIPRK
jgi:type II secretory pathway component GspD/PulD (secretin)